MLCAICLRCLCFLELVVNSIYLDAKCIRFVNKEDAVRHEDRKGEVITFILVFSAEIGMHLVSDESRLLNNG